MKVVVIGVGNPDRGDDGAGIEVVRRARKRVPKGVTVIESPGDAAALMDAWAGHKSAIVVDAAAPRGAPGRVLRLEAHGEPLKSGFFAATTHDLGVEHAVEFSRALGRLPGRVVIYGVEGRSFGHAEPMSKEVEEALDGVVDAVIAEARALVA